uniref:Uncharacterized protein MANES_13G039100 n=1 Tax=Rhizophora mucronata TaxID=61149 RepID=A0A2P2JDL2_RHIMU
MKRPKVTLFSPTIDMLKVLLGRSISNKWKEGVIFHKMCPTVHDPILCTNHHSRFHDCGLRYFSQYSFLSSSFSCKES